MENEMQRGRDPGSSGYVAIIRRCIKSKDLDAGKRLHAEIITNGWHKDIYVANLLIQMYGQFRCIQSAYAVFRGMHARNLFTWNIMITAYAQNGYLSQAKSLFCQSPTRDIVAWNSLLTISAQTNRLEEAREIFYRMPARSTVSGNVLISAYAQAGHAQDARTFFNEMLDRNASTWNNMINAYVQSGELEHARALFDVMPQRDQGTWSLMIHAYTRRKLLEQAEQLFSQLEEPDVMSKTCMIVGYGLAGRISDAYSMFTGMVERDTVSYNAMVQAFAEIDHTDKARQIFDSIPRPNLSSFNAMIAAYAQQGNVQQAKEIFDQTKSRNVVTWTAMMNAYGQAGQVEEAKGIFDTMPEPNTVSWTTMITAYAQNDMSREALQLFRCMDLAGVEATRVTYVSVLYACSDLTELQLGRLVHRDVKSLHRRLYFENVVGNSLMQMYGRCGKLEEARTVFDEMVDRSTPSWNTMISAYSKAGHGPKALRLFELMAVDGDSRPDCITFMSILFACSHAGLVEVTRSQFRSMSMDYQLEPWLDHYVCVIDILARAGQVEKAEELLKTMPFVPDDVAYTTFVVACKSQGEMLKASTGAKLIMDLLPEQSTGYVLLSNFNRPDFAKLSQEIISVH